MYNFELVISIATSDLDHVLHGFRFQRYYRFFAENNVPNPCPTVLRVIWRFSLLDYSQPIMELQTANRLIIHEITVQVTYHTTTLQQLCGQVDEQAGDRTEAHQWHALVCVHPTTKVSEVYETVQEWHNGERSKTTKSLFLPLNNSTFKVQQTLHVCSKIFRHVWRLSWNLVTVQTVIFVFCHYLYP